MLMVVMVVMMVGMDDYASNYDDENDGYGHGCGRLVCMTTVTTMTMMKGMGMDDDG